MKSQTTGNWLGVGAAIGVGVGVAMQSVWIGIAVGLIFALTLTKRMSAK